MDGGFSNYQEDLGSSIENSLSGIAAGFIDISKFTGIFKK